MVVFVIDKGHHCLHLCTGWGPLTQSLTPGFQTGT